MKLVPKLTLMFILSTSAVLGVNGYLRVRREVGLFESDRVRDHLLMNRVVARAALAVWQTDGAERAIAMVNELDSHSSKFEIRWLPLRPAVGQASELESALAKLAPGETLTVASRPGAGGRERCLYTTLASVTAPPPGAISLCESFAAQDAYVKK